MARIGGRRLQSVCRALQLFLEIARVARNAQSAFLKLAMVCAASCRPKGRAQAPARCVALLDRNPATLFGSLLTDRTPAHDADRG
jgi:hypothetical protein